MNKAGRPHSLLRRLISNIAITVGLLLASLLLALTVGALVLGNQRANDEKRLNLSNVSNTLLTAMTDQETGLRGYITTADTSFLEPYTAGRAHYTEALRKLQTDAANDNFSNILTALRMVTQRADAWSVDWAQVQIDRVKAGDLAQPRSLEVSRDGKNRFDGFRTASADLEQAIIRDLARLQRDNESFQFSMIAITVLLSLVALFFIWRTSSQFVNGLRTQLNGLTDVADRLEAGDLTARVSKPSQDELGQLGQNFNMMAEALEAQQSILKEKDIQDNVLRINNSLNSSLKIEELLNQFLQELAQVLDVQISTIYLYNKETDLLTIGAVQGINRSKVTPFFQLGEGLLGQAAANRKPSLVQNLDSNEAVNQKLTLKTILGEVVPATIYNQPLLQGNELLGVLMTGTLYPMNESTRNVLSIISTGLASAISNAQAYQYIQSQAEELERRKTELERGNHQLSRQRDELAVLNSALEEANRLRSQFISTMSHELRTPLTAIIGFSQLLLRGPDITGFSPRQRGNLEHILKNGQNLLMLVNDVLDIAKIEAGRMELSETQIDLSELFQELIGQTQSLWSPKGLRMEYEVEAGLGIFESDQNKLRQILINLISNAIKFTDKGGIKLSAKVRPSEVGYFDGNESLVAVSVNDSGIGIASEQQQHIFEEFYQADSSSTRRYGGTGLGLSIVRKLSDLLGGQIQLESTQGLGSTFTVVLPRQNRTRPEDRMINSSLLRDLLPAQPPPLDLPYNNPPPEEMEDVVAETGKRLVLAVDDDPGVLTIIRQTLEDSDYQVVGLADPRQVYNMVAKFRPYAITLDVMMPELNGWQILQQLKSDPTTAAIPVIMLTVVSDRSAGYVLGASDYLVKPIERDLLLKTLDRLAQRQDSALQLVGEGPVRSQPPGRGEQSPAGTPPQERRYVLVVDDAPDVRDILEQTIVAAGYYVKTAAGGREALQLAQDERPGLILLDLMMPGMDGFEVLDKLKTDPRTASVPVVIQTARNLTAQEREKLKAGAIRIIEKGSVPLNQLVEELNSYIKK